VIKTIVVLDTNIFISAVFWESSPYEIVKKAISQEIIVFISDDIIEEIKEVLARDFSLEKQEIDDIIDSFVYFTHFIEPREKVEVVKEDPDDNRILECSAACGAKFIISYNKHLLKLKEFRGAKIMLPGEFLRIFKTLN
jgi:putative PIN family toxin of toxin-antitoxin system